MYSRTKLLCFGYEVVAKKDWAEVIERSSVRSYGRWVCDVILGTGLRVCLQASGRRDNDGCTSSTVQ